MKRKLKILPLVLCASMLLSLSAAADVLGKRIDGSSATLAAGLTLTEQNLRTASGYRREHYMVLSPDSTASATVVSAEKLWTRQSLSSAAATLEAEGLRVLGGINGGFYTVATGEPVGLVVSGGVLRADDEGLCAVGFRTDGSAIMGKPELKLSLRIPESETEIVAAGLNRNFGPGLRIYTPDCVEAIHPTAKSLCVLCAAEKMPAMGQISHLTVEQVWETEESIVIPEGHILLLMFREWNGAAQSLPESICEGAELELNCACSEGWETVDSAVGILYPLLTDGKTEEKLETAAAPRTAIGLKADGSIVLYTVDGRQSGYSDGAGLAALAQRMQELGCVTAGALDGGGSTQMAAQLPGETSLSMVNKPSESGRKVSNYIFLTASAEPVRSAEYLALYPLHITAVSGAEIPLEVKAIDRSGGAAAAVTGLSYTVNGGVGTVHNGVFYASGSGTGTITVSAWGLKSAEIPVYVTDHPETLELYGEKYGKNTKSLTLDPGQEVDLTVHAMYGNILLESNDLCYSWTLEPAVGTVDETGHLIPGNVSGTGTLTAAIGEQSVSIPITVWTGVPFTDVSTEDPYFDAVKYVYTNHIFEGTSGTTFAPDTVMTRAMLVTVLWRMCGQPEPAGASGFADVAADAWYAQSVAWAAETGLVNGYSDTVFAPTDDLTREQILTILHRWAGLPEAQSGQNTEGASEYAVPALRWALENGLVTPDAESGLQPRSAMNRAGVAAVLLRYHLLGE